MGPLLKILTDLDCELWVDQEFAGEIVKGIIYKKKLNAGNYIIELKREGKTLKFYDIVLSNEQEILLKTKLTRKVNISIINKLLLFPGYWAIEGDFIDSHELDTFISIDGVNWNKYKHSFEVPLNYDGLQIKFDYGYENIDWEGKETKEIKHSYQFPIFWQNYNNYIFYQTLNINEPFISSLNPFDFNNIKEYKEDNINIEINASWLNIKEINTLFYKVNNNWYIKRFGDGLKKYNSFSINPEVTKIKGIEPPYLLVSNGEKESYDDIYSMIYNPKIDRVEKVSPDTGLIIFYKIGKKIGWWDIYGNKSNILAEDICLTKHWLSFLRYSYESKDEIFYVKKDGKWGLFSYLRGQLVPFEYDELFEYEFDTETLIYFNEIDKVRKGEKEKIFCKEILDQILFYENGGYGAPDLNQIPKSSENDFEELNYDILLQKAVKFNLLDPIIKIKGKIDGVMTIKEFSLL